jgi:hypothetical protein
MSLAYRFMVSTGALILWGVAQPAFSEDLGATPIDAEAQVGHSLKPPPFVKRRSLLCDSLGAGACFRALARQAGQDTTPKATPVRPQ